VLGLQELWGYLALSSGDCGSELPGVLGASGLAAVLLVVLYALLVRMEARSGAAPKLVLPRDPAPTAPEAACVQRPLDSPATLNVLPGCSRSSSSYSAPTFGSKRHSSSSNKDEEEPDSPGLLIRNGTDSEGSCVVVAEGRARRDARQSQQRSVSVVSPMPRSGSMNSLSAGLGAGEDPVGSFGVNSKSSAANGPPRGASPATEQPAIGSFSTVREKRATEQRRPQQHSSAPLGRVLKAPQPTCAPLARSLEDRTPDRASDIFVATFSERRHSLGSLIPHGSGPPPNVPAEAAAQEAAAPATPTPFSEGLPMMSEKVDHFRQDPINFGAMMHVDDSDSSELHESSDGEEPEEGQGEDGDEVWTSPTQLQGGDIEVPIWLLEKLRERGWEPPDPGGTEKKDRPQARPAPLDQREEGGHHMEDAAEDRRQQQAGSGGCSGGAAAAGSTNAFWKIPMPTRKNTRVALARGADGSAPADDDDPEMGSFLAGGAAGEEPSGGALGGERDLTLKSLDADGPACPKVCKPCHEGARRVSFMDEEQGVHFDKYSEEKRHTNLLGAISEDAKEEADSEVTVSMFPVKRMSMMTQGFGGDDDPGSTMPPEGSWTDVSARKRGSSKRMSALGRMSFNNNRRPSALGCFSDDNAKSPGLYALPRQAGEARGSEVVEVRRQSLVMSTSMLNDILRTKLDGHMDVISERNDEGREEEVVLPFFTAMMAGRQCNCKTDPDSGYVIHTCMTPAATGTTNTGAMQSYVCSEWGSRRQSCKVSKNGSLCASRAAKSRRGSYDLHASDGEDEDPEAAAEAGAPERPNKRIRNASVLAIVGGAGPTPANKTEADDEPAPENELAISFKNIAEATPRDSVFTQCDQASMKDEDGCGRDMDALCTPLDQQVENELGHRFDLVEPGDLAKMLENQRMREQLLIVDVRGRDWVGGHIPSSINLRTSEVTANPRKLLLQCRQNRIHHIIFTCMYSVLRARKCAVAVQQEQLDEQQGGHGLYRIRISLLRGGMHAWTNHFAAGPVAAGDEPPKAVIDCFDPEMWSDGGPSQGGLVHVMDAIWSEGGQKALSDALAQELQSLMSMQRRNSSTLSSTQTSRRNSAQGEQKEPRCTSSASCST